MTSAVADHHEGPYKFHPGMLVRAVDNYEFKIVKNHLYILGHRDGRNNMPNYWVMGENGVYTVVPEHYFERAEIRT